MSEEPILVQLIRKGKIFFKEGKMIAFGEMGIIIPVRVMNKLSFLLTEKVGKEDARGLLCELGKYQINQAIKRYIKVFGWSEIEKEKGLEFGFKYLTSFLGLGVFQVKKRNDTFSILTTKTPFAEEFVMEYGKQKEPIDDYLRGIWEEVFTIFLGKPMVCEEVKCYAKGDDCCEFIVKPKEEAKEEKE